MSAIEEEVCIDYKGNEESVSLEGCKKWWYSCRKSDPVLALAVIFCVRDFIMEDRDITKPSFDCNLSLLRVSCKFYFDVLDNSSWDTKIRQIVRCMQNKYRNELVHTEFEEMVTMSIGYWCQNVSKN